MTKPHLYKYVIAEDEPLIRKNIMKKIDSLPLPLRLCGETDNGVDALQYIENCHPDILITDIRMPQLDGLELSRQTAQCYPSVKTIIISSYNEFSFAQKAVKYGVKDFLLKPVKTEDLSAALQNALILLESENKNLDHFSLDPYSINPEEVSRLMENYLIHHFTQDISMKALSKKFGFTNEYLTKIFKRYIGATPTKYLTTLRINEAKRLLVNQPHLEIKKIGELVGYQDAFYFSRVFKNHTGVHPSEYRLNPISRP